MERICTHTENLRNEVYLQTTFRCSYTENTHKEFVCILGICGMNLLVYSEYVDRARKVKYLGEFETKIGNILGQLSGA